jgi:hypothetical protein
MIQSAETRLDDSTLIVRIPMRFQRRGGRKRIVAPDGSEIAPTTNSQPDSTLVKALARAWRWQRMLDEGVYATVSKIADPENISKSYVKCSSLIAADDASLLAVMRVPCRLCGSLRGRRQAAASWRSGRGAPM